MAMDLYFRSRCKAGKAAAAKAATNSLNAGKKCSTLYQPSLGFNLTDPYCHLLETTYKSLHDPHLKSYYQRKDMLRRLRRGGFITSNNKVICSLSEFNKYRQYLTSLKIDFEREYTREHRTIKTHVNKVHEGQKVYNNCDAAKFQEWLLQKGTQTTPDQELVIKRRYLDMISKEVNKIEDTTEYQSMLRMKKEKRLYQDHIRRKLNLCGQIEEEWKNKEMLLLTKIGEEAKRNMKVEEQRRKIREEIAQKKQAYLEKKIAYHLQKMQRNDHKEESAGSTSENKGQDETGPVHFPKSNNKISAQKLSTSLPCKQDVQNNATEQKKDKETTKTSDPLKNIDNRPAINIVIKKSDEDDRRSDPSAKLTEESLTDLDSESSSVKFITLFQRESVFDDSHPSDDNISDGSQTPNPVLPNKVLK